MSKLKAKGAKLTLGEKEYELLFTVNVIDEIEDELKIDIDEIKKAIFKAGDKENTINSRINYQNVAFIIFSLVKENCEIRKDNGENINIPTLKQVKRMICNVNIGDCLVAITSAFMCSFLVEEDEENPNEESNPTAKK